MQDANTHWNNKQSIYYLFLAQTKSAPHYKKENAQKSLHIHGTLHHTSVAAYITLYNQMNEYVFQVNNLNQWECTSHLTISTADRDTLIDSVT